MENGSILTKSVLIIMVLSVSPSINGLLAVIAVDKFKQLVVVESSIGVPDRSTNIHDTAASVSPFEENSDVML